MNVKKLLNLNGIVIVGVVLILIMNFGYFMIKFGQVFSGINKRSPQGINHFIKKHIPSKSKVVTDPLLYYAIINAEADMQFLNLYDTLPSREQIHRAIYKYDYLIITDNLKQRAKLDVNYYLSQASFDTVATYQVKSNELNQFINQLNLVSQTEEQGYNCIILKRKSLQID